MAALYKTIPADVKTIIDAGSFTDSVATFRGYAPSFEPKDLPTAAPWHIYIVPEGLEALVAERHQPAAPRGPVECRYTVDVAVAAHVPPHKTDVLDALALVVEEMQNIVMATPELATFGVFLPPFNNSPYLSATLLRENNVFLSLTQFTYAVIRP